MSNDIIKLNLRPKKSIDFFNGSDSTVSAGKKYVWGDNINYNSKNCSLGYWPPGQLCPIAKKKYTLFKLNPAPEITGSGCFTGNGLIGYAVNGAAFYGINDGFSFNNKGIWSNTVPEFSKYDFDVCNGNAGSNGYYRHHHYSNCLSEKLGDIGAKHSPIYGWVIDGFPVYGPYQSYNTFAISCWQKRDYRKGSPTGCATGSRSCILVNEFDYTQGTIEVNVSDYGPSLTDKVPTPSGYTIPASVGVYYEDYYFNASCAAQVNLLSQPSNNC